MKRSSGVRVEFYDYSVLPILKGEPRACQAEASARPAGTEGTSVRARERPGDPYPRAGTVVSPGDHPAQPCIARQTLFLKSRPVMYKRTYHKSLIKSEALRVGLLWISLILSSTSALGQDDYLEKSFSLQELRVQITSKGFADRIALPPDNAVEELIKGLYALQFLVERREGGPVLACGLKAYFDNSLHPYTPSNSVAGSLLLQRAPTHFFFRRMLGDAAGWAKWSESDRIFSSTKEGEFFRSAAISSGDYLTQQKGNFDSVPIREFHREVLPGVAYVMLSPDCNVLERINPIATTWKLWIKRQGGADYRRTLKEDERDFIIFELPRSFLERIRPIAARANAYNNTNVGKTNPSDR